MGRPGRRGDLPAKYKVFDLGEGDEDMDRREVIVGVVVFCETKSARSHFYDTKVVWGNNGTQTTREFFA